jgi:hypothetical protein
MKSYDYINEVKRIKGLDTDYKVAKLLNCGQNKITQYKNGTTMDNETARQIAEIINIPVFEVIANMEVQRAKDAGIKKTWERLAKMTHQAAFATPSLLISLSIFSLGAIEYILC